MSREHTDAATLLARAKSEPSKTPARAEALKLAARSAEAANDVTIAYEARELLIDASLWCGEIRDALVAFAACLAQCDRDPERFPEANLHWKYKWVLEWAPRFPEISRAQVEHLVADAEARFSKRALGASAIAKIRAMTSAYLGDIANVEVAYDAWKRTKRDSLSDCLLCDQHADVQILQALGRDEDAARAAAGIFGRGAMCAEVPHITYGVILPSILRLGRREDAVRYQRRGYTLLKRMTDKHAGDIGEHLIATTVLGDLGRGLRILRETIAHATAHPVGHSRMKYFAGAGVLLERVGRTQKTVKIAIPRDLGGTGVPALADPRALSADFLERAQTHATQLDARNGNTATSELIASFLAFREQDLPGPPETTDGGDA